MHESSKNFEQDESELVDDEAKARAMAEASDYARTQAAKERQRGADESYVPALRREAGARVEFWERKAAEKEEDAEIQYEAEKKALNMTDEQLQAAINRSVLEFSALDNALTRTIEKIEDPQERQELFDELKRKLTVLRGLNEVLKRRKEQKLV